MAENDFIGFIFKLNPFLTVLIVWFFGFGSLVLVALKSKSLRESLLRSPGVIIGDFFLLPTSGFLITYFFQNVQKPLEFLSSTWWNVILIFAAILALISARRFKHLSIWWLPHNIFYFLMVYFVMTFLVKGFLQLSIGKEGLLLWIIWILALGTVTTHQLLGIFYPKKFPRI